jgi:hypothetical protein
MKRSWLICEQQLPDPVAEFTGMYPDYGPHLIVGSSLREHPPKPQGLILLVLSERDVVPNSTPMAYSGGYKFLIASR